MDKNSKEFDKFVERGFVWLGDDLISPLQVMKSAAGYYIGRSCIDFDCGNAEFPYSRESGYFATREFAQTILDEEYK